MIVNTPPPMIHSAINKLTEYQNLTSEEAQNIMEQIMTGAVSDPEIASFLTASRMKEVTTEELIGFLRVMKKKVTSITYTRTEPLLDVCGTGGAQFKTFNVSTSTAFVLASAGVSVAKHGNRSSTSKCGSADILEALGFNINVNKEVAESLLNTYQFTFLFAQNFHPAMKYVAPIRKLLGIRTIFNILGPLTNPANVDRQLIGVFNKSLIPTFLSTFKNYNYKSALVVHGEIGADEFMTCGKSFVGQLKDGEITLSEISPKDLGLKNANPNELANIEPQKAAKRLVEVFQGTNDALTDFIALNSAAGFLVAEKVNTLAEGVELAHQTIKSGKPLDLLIKMIIKSGGDIDHFNKFYE